MKKTLALLLALILCMTAFGCSSVQSVSNDKQNSPAPTDELTKNPSVTEEPTETSAPTPTAVPTPVPTSTPVPTLAPEPSPTYDYEQMIRDLFAHINERKYISYANCYAPTVRDFELKVVKSEWNREQKMDVFNYKHIDVLGIEKLNERYYSPYQDFYSDLNELVLDTDDFDSFYVKTNLDVYNPNEHESDGEFGFVVTTVKEDGEWYIGLLWYYDPMRGQDQEWMERWDKFYAGLELED